MFRIYETDRPGFYFGVRFYFGVLGLDGVAAAKAKDTFYAAQTWCRATLPPGSWHPEQWTVVIHDAREAALFKIRWC